MTLADARLAEARLLLVEDDEALAETTAAFLTSLGHRVEVMHEGGGVVERVLADPPDAVLLDVELPGESGLSICQRLRGMYTGPILMLTGRTSPYDEVVGLEMGADDYVMKPVLPRVLALRVAALLRRAAHPTPQGDHPYVDRDLTLDPSAYEVRVQGRIVPLKPTEYELLAYLVAYVGQPVTREMYYRDVRGIIYDGEDRLMDAKVSRLRRALVAAGLPEARLRTLRGDGYLLTRV